MERIAKILLENKAWAQNKINIDPDFFVNMAKDQTPTYLWIGCADSRIQPNEITNTRPGEMFVQRNIANLVYEDDKNLMSVIQYAVINLKVKHIILCGHYGCGGVIAAYKKMELGLITDWVRSITETHLQFKLVIEKEASEKAQINKLVELNVENQVRKLKNLPLLKNIKVDERPYIHGWVYDLESGLIKVLEVAK